MCFSSPKIPAITPPPTAREGVIAGVQRCQANTADSATSTNLTGGTGDTSAASTYRPKLGS